MTLQSKIDIHMLNFLSFYQDDQNYVFYLQKQWSKVEP